MTREEYVTKLFSLYTLVTVLSEKNDGLVMRLRNKENGRDLVLRSFPKYLDAYETLCDVRCENLPEIYESVALEDGQIVLEQYIDGLTLAQAMETGRYHYMGARKVMLGLCNALTVLHKRSLVHRDIKPENVMLDKDGRVVLIDFNASRNFSQGGIDTVILGTVGYAAPEQLGLLPTDARTHIYAAGVLLNVMLTGKHPSDRFASGWAGRIVRKCTALNPNDRYQTAKKLAQQL